MNLNSKSLSRIATLTVTASLAANLTNLFLQWYEVTPFGYLGGILCFIFMMALVFALMASVVVAPITLLLSLSKKMRPQCIRLSLISALFFATTVVFVNFSPDVRMTAFHDLATRSEPLVSAIHRYAEDKGTPPVSLSELVPDYIDQVPGTGIPRYPDYVYTTEDRWDDNPWVLYVPTSRGMINWDMFMYFPLQNYPEEGYGGRLVKIGQWAYVHE